MRLSVSGRSLPEAGGITSAYKCDEAAASKRPLRSGGAPPGQRCRRSGKQCLASTGTSGARGYTVTTSLRKKICGWLARRLRIVSEGVTRLIIWREAILMRENWSQIGPQASWKWIRTIFPNLL